MARKKRKPPAKAPSIRPTGSPVPRQTPQAAGGQLPPDPLRPDPDQPPDEGPAGRPSVYSEWLNSPVRRSSPKSAWLNSSLSEPLSPFPPARAAARGTGAPVAPRGTHRPESAAPARPEHIDAAEAASTSEALWNDRYAADTGQADARVDVPAAGRFGGDAAASEAPPREAGGRKRRTTAAKRLAATDRLDVDLDRIAPARPTAGMAPGGVPLPEAVERPTRVLPALPRDPIEDEHRGTTARFPAARGGTAGRMPTPPPRSTAARLPVTRRDTAGGSLAARRDTAMGLAAVARDRAQVPAELAHELTTQSVLIRGARNPRPTGPVVPRRLRPPSIVMQACVALMTVVVLMGALVVTSPLGYGAAVNGTFQAYTTAVKWVPTPTPTATPIPPPLFSDVPASPGTQAIINEIKTVFGPYSTGALNIAHCESGFDPLAHNPYPVGNSHAEGVFQILFPSTWMTTSFAAQNPYNADANIHAAWEIFSRDGHTWVEWQCKSY